MPLRLLPLLLCLGCANMEHTRTGFLSDYECLEPAPERKVWGVPDDVLLWQSPRFQEAASAGSYDRVLVEPVVYRPVEDARHELSEEAAKDLADWSTERLELLLEEEGFEILESLRPGAVRLRMAVTDVNPSNVFVNVIGVILVVPPDMGGLSGEIELADAMSGEPLLRMSALREGTPFLLWECFFKYGHTRHGVSKWTLELAELMRGE